MAIFGKPPAKKVQLPKPTDRGVKRSAHVVSARELASQVANRKAEKPRGLEPLGETSLRGASIIDWSTAPKAIEVAQANPGLVRGARERRAAVCQRAGCSGARAARAGRADGRGYQAVAARLARAVRPDAAGERSHRVRPAVDAIRGAVRALGAGVGRARQAVDGRQARRRRLHRRHRQVVERHVRAARRTEACAREMRAARTDRPVVGQRFRRRRREGARRRSRAGARASEWSSRSSAPRSSSPRSRRRSRSGKEGGEGAWMLSLELLQWQHEQAKFDERAVDFAVAFEVSPPSWEPPPRTGDKDAAATAGKAPVEARAARAARTRRTSSGRACWPVAMPQQLAQAHRCRASRVGCADRHDRRRPDRFRLRRRAAQRHHAASRRSARPCRSSARRRSSARCCC